MHTSFYDVVIYQHLPKCGGRSFINACEKHLNRQSDTPGSYSTKEQRADFAKAKKDFTKLTYPALLHGHLIHDGIQPLDRYREELANDRVALITVIRDPLERAISAYFHRRRKGKDTGETLPQALATRKNSICRSLGIEMGWSGTPKSDPYLMIGFTERLQDSVDLLAALVGFPSEQTPHINQSPRDPVELTAKQIKDFKTANAKDYAFHEYAKARFERMLQRMKSSDLSQYREEYPARKKRAFVKVTR